MPGGRDSDSTEDEEPHSHQSSSKPMEVAGEELDNQQAARNVEAHVLAPERESSHDSVERVVAASNPVASREPAGERVTGKGKEKVDEKMKELVFIGGVELVDLDDCDVRIGSCSVIALTRMTTRVPMRTALEYVMALDCAHKPWIQMMNLHPGQWLQK
jgi:hypothetical protein